MKGESIYIVKILIIGNFCDNLKYIGNINTWIIFKKNINDINDIRRNGKAK